MSKLANVIFLQIDHLFLGGIMPIKKIFDLSSQNLRKYLFRENYTKNRLGLCEAKSQ